MRYLFVLLLCGCSTVTHEWTKDGANTADQDRDYAECSEPHKGAAFALGILGQSISDSAITDCMKAKGWQSPK